MHTPESTPGGNSSKRKALNSIYDEINRVATPGDIIFFISDSPTDAQYPLVRRQYRQWQGFDAADLTRWHTSIYVGPIKESRGSQKRPHIVHAVENGVEEIHIPPSFFTSVRMDTGEVVRHGRIEVVHHSESTAGNREEVVNYARQQLGKSFDDLNWRYLFWTYFLGLPTRRLDTSKVSCHGLAFNAYEKVGLKFAHQLENVPPFNPAKYLGHPIYGHPPDRVNLNRLYLVDHHLYRDPRFKSVLTIFEDTQTQQIKTAENPAKYSWNPHLQKRYNLDG
jgi:hypothetical protein